MWESSYSAFNHDEYVNIKKFALESQLYTKPQIKYNNLNRYDGETEYKFNRLIALRSFLNTNIYGNNKLNLNFFSENNHST
jgi:hypothetical protein